MPDATLRRISMKDLARYQVILLGEQRHIRCEQLAQGCCPNNAAVRVEPATSWSRVQRSNHYTTKPPLLAYFCRTLLFMQWCQLPYASAVMLISAAMPLPSSPASYRPCCNSPVVMGDPTSRSFVDIGRIDVAVGVRESRGGRHAGLLVSLGMLSQKFFVSYWISFMGTHQLSQVPMWQFSPEVIADVISLPALPCIKFDWGCWWMVHWCRLLLYVTLTSADLLPQPHNARCVWHWSPVVCVDRLAIARIEWLTGLLLL